MPRSQFVLLKVLFSVLVFIPSVHAQSPAPTQSTSNETRTEAAPALSSSANGLGTATETATATPSPTVPGKTFEEYFQLGTKNYQEKNYEGAIANFQQALKLQPESTAVLTDLGLSHYQLKQKGLAIGYFRRALFIDPSLPTAAAALKFALSELEVKEIPHRIETYERLRSSVLNSVSLNGMHLLTALLLFASGYIWLQYWGRRRKADEAEDAPPNFPLIGVFLALGFIASLSITILKIYDLSMPRATVIAEKVGAQIAPGEGQNSLFELYAGFEVLLSNSSPGWTQVRYPGGLTGWVKNDTLMPASGQNAF